MPLAILPKYNNPLISKMDCSQVYRPGSFFLPMFVFTQTIIHSPQSKFSIFLNDSVVLINTESNVLFKPNPYHPGIIDPKFQVKMEGSQASDLFYCYKALSPAESCMSVSTIRKAYYLITKKHIACAIIHPFSKIELIA